MFITRLITSLYITIYLWFVVRCSFFRMLNFIKHIYKRFLGFIFFFILIYEYFSSHIIELHTSFPAVWKWNHIWSLSVFELSFQVCLVISVNLQSIISEILEKSIRLAIASTEIKLHIVCICFYTKREVNINEINNPQTRPPYKLDGGCLCVLQIVLPEKESTCCESLRADAILCVTRRQYRHSLTNLQE